MSLRNSLYGLRAFQFTSNQCNWSEFSWGELRSFHFSWVDLILFQPKYFSWIYFSSVRSSSFQLNSIEFIWFQLSFFSLIYLSLNVLSWLDFTSVLFRWVERIWDDLGWFLFSEFEISSVELDTSYFSLIHFWSAQFVWVPFSWIGSYPFHLCRVDLVSVQSNWVKLILNQFGTVCFVSGQFILFGLTWSFLSSVKMSSIQFSSIQIR